MAILRDKIEISLTLFFILVKFDSPILAYLLTLFHISLTFRSDTLNLGQSQKI